MSPTPWIVAPAEASDEGFAYRIVDADGGVVACVAAGPDAEEDATRIVALASAESIPHRPYCAYCGKRYRKAFETAEEAFAVGREHIETCEKHPLAAERKLCDRLATAVMRWDEAEDLEWRDEAAKELNAPLASYRASRERTEPCA